MNEAKHIELNKTKWDKWAVTYDRNNWRSKYLRRAQRNVISLLDLKENINILDIGCGTGYALGQVAKLIYGKGQFFGIDLSSKMIDKAQENFKGKENFHFIKANAESIPLDDNLFDIIICTNSFHHYLHPNKVLEEMDRLLSTRGRLYILDPTLDSWFFKILGGIMKIFERTLVKIYSSKEFAELMVNAGLKYIGTKKINSNKIHIGEKKI